MPHQAVPDLLAYGRQIEAQLFPVVRVLLEGRFCAERFADAVRRNFPFVDTPGIAVIAVSGFSEMLHECRLVPETQVGSGTDTEAVHLFGRYLADAEEALDGQPGYEFLDPVRRNRKQSVGFPVVGGDLCQHLVDRDSGRSRQSGFSEDARFDLAGDQRCRAGMGYVQERFVERKGFYEFGIFTEDGANLLRNGFVDIEPCRDEDQFRA